MKQKIIKDLAPCAGNLRNSEGSFVRLKNGRIVFAYSRFIGHEDGANCDVAMVWSDDDGETFSDEKVIITCKQCNADNIMSVSLVPMQDDSVGVFYLKKYGDLQCRSFMRRTFDFESFSEEVDCMHEDGYFVVNNDRIRRLKNGKLIYPAAYTPTKKIDQAAPAGAAYSNVQFYPAEARFYISEDDGYTWKRTGECQMPYAIFTTGLQEPGIEELDDGRLYAYFRNDSGRQFEAYSSDEGKNWTVPAPSIFTSPISPMSTKRMSDGRIAIVFNPVPLYFGRSQQPYGTWTGARNPYVITFADGNMNNLSEIRVFENDDHRGFCYCAIFETKDSLLLGYCAGGDEDGGTLSRLRITKIAKDGLMD